jgi:hypothetical protein
VPPELFGLGFITIDNTMNNDIKKITEILNKISIIDDDKLLNDIKMLNDAKLFEEFIKTIRKTTENNERLLHEIKKLNYTDPVVFSIMFKKILIEPKFSKMYAQLCEKLTDLHLIIKDKCIYEFNKNKHKNLARFIGELYGYKLIELNDFVMELHSDIMNADTTVGEKEKSLEILHEIFLTVGIKNIRYNHIIVELFKIKDTFKPRFRFKILDLKEGM